MKETKVENAARYIQHFWRKAQSKLPKDLSLYVRDFKAATIEDIRDGKHDKAIFNCINHCVARNNRVGLQLLAYSLLSGPAIKESEFGRDLSDLIFILYVLFHDKISENRDIGTVLKDAYLKWQYITRTYRIYPLKQENNKENFWTGYDGKTKAEDLVSISHGGGLFHITNFLRSRSQGYRLEHNGLGLQVSPNDNSRDLDYAVRTSRYHFDRPAILRANIPAKHLTPAPRFYEAGLRPESLKALRDIEMEEVDENVVNRLWLCRIDEQSIYKHYSSNSELRTRILNTVNRLEQAGTISVVRYEEMAEKILPPACQINPR